MTANLTEDEQLQALKKWWQDNGRSTILLIVIFIAVYAGWYFWQDYRQQQAESAAALYQELMEAVAVAPTGPFTEEQRKTAAYLIDQLQVNHGHSLYAVSASMHGAKMAVLADDLEQASVLLQWALDHSDSDETSYLLRLRLARLMNARKDYDQALTLSRYDAVDDQFTSLFAAVRGDAYLGRGELAAARAAYQLALDNLSPVQHQQQRLLTMKIADLPMDKSTTDGADKGDPE